MLLHRPSLLLRQGLSAGVSRSCVRRHNYRQLQADMSLGLCNQQRLLMECAADPGVSSWLTAEPLAESGFILKEAPT